MKLTLEQSLANLAESKAVKAKYKKEYDEYQRIWDEKKALLNKKVTPVKKQFDIKEFISKTEKLVIADLIILSAHGELMLKQMTENEFIKLIKEVNEKYRPNELSDIENYLLSIKLKATPQALKETKKSVKGFIEYIIYKDTKAGLISLETSKEAKEALPTFLSNNKDCLKDVQTWIN